MALQARSVVLRLVIVVTMSSGALVSLMHNSGSTISIVVDSGKGLLQSVFMPWNIASLVALAGLLQVLLCQSGIERD